METPLPPKKPFLQKIFLSPDQTRLRAGWRLLIQTVSLVLIGSCLIVPLFTVLFLLDPSLLSSLLQLRPEYLLLGTIAEAIAVTASVFLARRFIDRQPIESLGLKVNNQALLDVLAGMGIALLQMGFLYVLMLGLGWLTFEGFAWEFDPVETVLSGVLIFFCIFILVGWSEELLSRGYHLQTIASGTNLFWAVIISSAVFSFLHFRNPSATWASTAGIFFAGIYLAYGYIRTRQLWLPIGLHIGWNFFEGVVFGFPVSGLDIYALTRITVQGPELWTGGAFGPEAGLIVLPSLVLGALLIYLY
ncbi:MAG TPA: type II CAAX endopeptidase family protein, partial [Anaerolineales bacterium]